MKKIFLFLGILFSGFVSAQELAGDDYLMLHSSSDTLTGNYIFKLTKQVYFGFNIKTNAAENHYGTSKKRVKALFDFAEKIKFTSMKSLDEKQNSGNDFSVIEYRKDGIVYRVCWDTNAMDENSVNLNKLKEMMNSFW